MTSAETTNKKKSYPDEQYDGNPDNFETYEMDKITWQIENDFDNHLTETDPSTIPRVEQQYTVPADDDKDPHGPPGTVVRAESEAVYQRRLLRDFEQGKKIWAPGFRGTKLDARSSAMTAHKEKPYDARHMFATIRNDCGVKTQKQSGHLATETITRQKKPHQTIKAFNSEWKDGVRLLVANDMHLTSLLSLIYIYQVSDPNMLDYGP